MYPPHTLKRPIPEKFRIDQIQPNLWIAVLSVLAAIVIVIVLIRSISDDRYDTARSEAVLARGDVALIAVAPDGTPLWAKRLANGQTVYFGGRKALDEEE